MKARNDAGTLEAARIGSGSVSRDGGGSGGLGSRMESSIEDTSIEDTSIEDK
jgi:hypothetical protein